MVSHLFFNYKCTTKPRLKISNFAKPIAFAFDVEYYFQKIKKIIHHWFGTAIILKQEIIAWFFNNFSTKKSTTKPCLKISNFAKPIAFAVDVEYYFRKKLKKLFITGLELQLY